MKEELDIEGYKSSQGLNPSLPHKIQTTTSSHVQKFINAGMILVGKVSMVECGFDVTGCNPDGGTPRNPYDLDRYCGGSSSGSAASVAAGFVPISLGAGMFDLILFLVDLL